MVDKWDVEVYINEYSMQTLSRMGQSSDSRSSLSKELGESPRARVLREVRHWIETGTLEHDQPMPSERTLAERFGVDRRTVRGALNLLSEEGLLRGNGGKLRLVVGPSRRADNSGPGLLKDAVVVVAPTVSQLSGARIAPGWSLNVVLGAVLAVREAGLDVLTVHPERFCREIAERVAADRPHGVIVPDFNQHDRIVACAELARECGMNVVAYGDDPELATFDRVTSDHEAGAYELTRWLIGQGRRRILNVWPAPATLYWFPERRAGYERAMREAGLPVLEPVLVPLAEGDHAFLSRLWAGHLIESLQGEGAVDAIMLVSDGHSDIVADACRCFGKVPNRDVAIVGYDNYWADLPEVPSATAPLATVDKLNIESGTQLVRLLLDRGAGRLPAAPQRVVVAPRLVIVEPKGDAAAIGVSVSMVHGKGAQR